MSLGFRYCFGSLGVLHFRFSVLAVIYIFMPRAVNIFDVVFYIYVRVFKRFI